MQLWEYATAVIHQDKVWKAHNCPIAPNTLMNDCLTQMGNQGWELSGIVAHPVEDYVSSFTLFFKRPQD